MAWISVATPAQSWFWPQGLGADPSAPDCADFSNDALMVRGTLMFETALPALNRPRLLMAYDGGGIIPLHLSLQSLPGGGLVFILDQDGEILHGSINVADTGRADIIRVTYSWDSLARRGRIALEKPGDHVVHIVPVKNPKPMPLSDMLAITGDSTRVRIAPEVVFVAASTEIEPIGPLPTLSPNAPVATPAGFRPVAEIRAGDCVRGANGRDVTVAAKLRRSVPGIGSFRPVCLRAPYFGLQADIHVASVQKLVIDGSLVEYMFGTETVLAPAGHLSRFQEGVETPMAEPRLVTYDQLILPRNETLCVAGAALESLNIGRLRRKHDMLDATLLAGLDRAKLPEHPCPRHRVLKPFEAVVLAETRAA